jgi:hypothetical protein
MNTSNNTTNPIQLLLPHVDRTDASFLALETLQNFLNDLLSEGAWLDCLPGDMRIKNDLIECIDLIDDFLVS